MEFNATFLVTIITFVVFVFLMNKILYKPMAEIVAKRESLVDGNLSAADENRRRAEKLSEERLERLDSAKNEARIRYNDTLRKFKDKRAGLVKSAQDESSAELVQAYNNLNNITNETKEGLKGRMTDLANDIVEKMLGYRSEVQGFDNEVVNRILYH